MQSRPQRTVTQHLAVPGPTHTVTAPDLPGHGLSDPPAGDYSLGAHASAMRDQLVTLGHARMRTVIHRRGQTVGAAQQLHHHGFAKRLSHPVMTQISDVGHYAYETAPVQLVETRHGVTHSRPGHVSSSDHQVRQ